MAEDPADDFHAANGRVMGTVAVVAVLAVVVLSVTAPSYEISAMFVIVCLVFGVLAWAAMLRPALWITPTELVLRNMFDTVTIPLGAIDEIALRQVLVVRVGEKRYTSPVAGRPREGYLARLGTGRGNGPSHQDLVEERLRLAVRDARSRARRGVDASDVVVTRQPAWIEIGALVAVVVAFVVVLIA